MPKTREKPSPFQQFIRKSLKDAINELNGRKPEPFINLPAQHSEAWYRDRLSQKLKGRTEVSTPVGRIDILTKTEVIEVKEVSDWKAAIGQVKAYGRYYPKHRQRIHLFGQITQSKLNNIQDICKTEAVIVSYE